MAASETTRLVRSNGVEGPVDPAAKAQFGLAHGWLHRGRADRALHHFRRAIELDPDLEGAHVKLATILANERCWRDVVDASEAGLLRFPQQEFLHKLLVRSLTELHGHQAVLDRYGLKRIDDRPIEFDPGDVIGCLVVRNEADRVPWFLEENRRLGVSKWLAVDNTSTDGTLDLLAAHPDVHVWSTSMPFSQGNFGSAWFEALLSRHGLGHWVVMLDADEILCFPGYETGSIRELCVSLDRAGKRAASGVMVDMYGAGAIADTRYVPGDDFLEHCSFFDRDPYHDDVVEAGPFSNATFHFGGARKRVFGGGSGEYLVTKTPLVRYDDTVVLAGGQHWTSHSTDRIAHDGCAVLHFKYFSSFVDSAVEEAQREEHSEAGKQYKSYEASLARDARLSLYDSAASIRFESGEQLADLGIIDSAWRVGGFPSAATIASRTTDDGAPCPKWSVMITVHRRVHTLERAVRSVVDQAEGDMQIAIVADGSGDEIIGRIHEIVDSIPGAAGRVEIHDLAEGVGHPHVFNRCIGLARGDLVHILHDDDWVRTGFYRSLQEGFDSDQAVGAAFARHELAFGTGRSWTSWAEQPTAGVIDDWLDRISTECRVQFSSMVVRRSVYERIGGFTAGIGSAFDWEMWQRIAVHGSVWFEPSVLAVICRDGTAETDRLVMDGGQISDAISAIEHTRSIRPPDLVDRATSRARERFALHGLDLAATQIRAGHIEAALRNVSEALLASDTKRVVTTLQRLLEDARPEPT